MPETDKRAEAIIRLADLEKTKAQNFLNLYQQVADLIYPLENQITSFTTPGRDKSLDIRDPTAMFALDDMVAGLIGTWIPAGRLFFGLRVKNRQIAEFDHIKRWLALATQITHDEMFESNFMLQLHDTVKALCSFGTGNLYSEWNNKLLKLNYKDHHISTYTIKQDAQGNVDTVILEYVLTARQATDEFVNPGPKVTEKVQDLRTESDKFTFIHIVRPRINRNVMLVDKLNMHFESVFVNKTEKIIVEEGGFEELAFAVPRWEKSSCEKYGRGRGTILLSAVKELQQMHKDFIECGNKWNNPPLEAVDANIEGEVTTSPGGINHVSDINSIRGLQNQIAGNFPITKEMLEFQQTLIREGFYSDIWRQFGQLKGDRRVTLEIEARLKEGLRRLVSPVTRMEAELFTPLITRSVLLLIRNGRIPYPPPELRGQAFGVEYMGELAMAMRDFQARAFTQFANLVIALDPAFPDAKDSINMDRALPDIGITMGMKVEHLSTEEEIAAKRQARAQQLQQQQLMEAAKVAGKAYKDTSQKAEEESPASEMQEALVGV